MARVRRWEEKEDTVEGYRRRRFLYRFHRRYGRGRFLPILFVVADSRFLFRFRLCCRLPDVVLLGAETPAVPPQLLFVVFVTLNCDRSRRRRHLRRYPGVGQMNRVEYLVAARCQ